MIGEKRVGVMRFDSSAKNLRGAIAQDVDGAAD
jgi:hypothetical protein